MAKITIDGKACECDEGEYILQVARRCGVFIPALCYLSGGTPTLACRLCMVEADGKRVYSCNAKAKDGMVIYSRSPEIDAEREAITQVYCINHPMACGVCDQSGECELQNLAHLMRTNTQSYAIRDTAREVQDWGYLSYDPSLCIVCERCITAAKDRLGVDAFKLVPRGGDALSKEQKDAMPKDAYAVWNKLQKSLIARVNENDDCVNYGESAAVCPTGALVERAFKYVSNAWELRQIPASNPHSSDCELLYYEIKRRGIAANDAEVDARLKAIAEQNKLSFDQLKTAVESQGMNYADFRENVRRTLLEEKLYNSIFADIQRKTTPENVKKFYTQNSSLFTTFDSITLTRYIAKSQAPLDKIRANPKLRPSDVYVMQGTLKANQMDEGLKYIVTNVEQGKFSPIIPTRNGYEMFYVNDKKGLRTLDFDSVQDRAIEGYVTSERKKAVAEFNDRLRSNANIRIIERPQAQPQSGKDKGKAKVQKRN